LTFIHIAVYRLSRRLGMTSYYCRLAHFDSDALAIKKENPNNSLVHCPEIIV